jgi:hypothetical protein
VGENMKKIIVFIILASLIATMTTTVLAQPVNPDKGNGAPNGPHFNLNIIGVPKEKKGDLSGNGNVIFVKLWGSNTRINLISGDSFEVLDKDGTDGQAELQLMDPYPEDVSPGINTDEDAVYKIYVRDLGKPGGEVGITTGFTDESGVNWYSLESVNLTRTKGRSRFSDKTLELTTIYVDITDDDTDNPVRYNLFGNNLWEYFWDYDNSGLKLLQMRIYME